MIIWKNYRIRLYPNEEQLSQLISICETFRFCYNWGLAFANRYRDTHLMQPPSFYTLSDEFTVYRNSHPWLKDFDINTCRYALMNVYTAFECYLDLRANYPRFKTKKRHGAPAFRKFKVRGDRLTFWGDKKEYVHIPGFGRFKKDRIYCGTNHNIPTGPNVKYDNVYIKCDGIHFWLSMSVSTEIDDPVNTGTEIVGIDVGIRTPATLSTGESLYMGPNKLAMLDKRKRSLDRAYKRDLNRRKFIAERTKAKYENIPKTKNEQKRDIKRLTTYKRISNSYKYQYHVISKQIATNPNIGTVVIEDLHVRELQRNKFTSNIITQARLKILLRFIEYKSIENGKRVIKAPDTFPSSQICSNCGHIHKIGQGKIYRCPNCGLVIDRDYNAALNLRDYGISVLQEA